jgi:glutamine synthetase type III
VKPGGGSKKKGNFKLKVASASIPGGQSSTLKLKLSKSSLKKAKAALKNGAKLKAKIAVEVADAASNSSADSLAVRLH